MPKVQPPPLGRKKSEVSGVVMIISAIGLTIALTGAVVIFTPEKHVPVQEITAQPAKIIDFTGQLRYGKDESTGLCFVNIRTADTDQRSWRTFAHVSCKALERLEP